MTNPYNRQNTPNHTTFNDQNPRSYRCPQCGGEFDEWEKEHIHSDEECPFCGKRKGQYGLNANDVESGEKLTTEEEDEFEREFSKEILKAFGFDDEAVDEVIEEEYGDNNDE